MFEKHKNNFPFNSVEIANLRMGCITWTTDLEVLARMKQFLICCTICTYVCKTETGRQHMPHADEASS